jgi:hypothetical protein
VERKEEDMRERGRMNERMEEWDDEEVEWVMRKRECVCACGWVTVRCNGGWWVDVWVQVSGR